MCWNILGLHRSSLMTVNNLSRQSIDRDHSSPSPSLLCFKKHLYRLNLFWVLTIRVEEIERVCFDLRGYSLWRIIEKDIAKLHEKMSRKSLTGMSSSEIWGWLLSEPITSSTHVAPRLTGACMHARPCSTGAFPSFTGWFWQGSFANLTRLSLHILTYEMSLLMNLWWLLGRSVVTFQPWGEIYADLSRMYKDCLTRVRQATAIASNCPAPRTTVLKVNTRSFFCGVKCCVLIQRKGIDHT